MALYWARNPMTYNGIERDRGETFEFGGCLNDEKLARLRYCVPVPKKASTYECGECGAQFVEQTYRTAHGTVRHPKRAFTDAELERILDKEESARQKMYPLALDKTSATLNG